MCSTCCIAWNNRHFWSNMNNEDSFFYWHFHGQQSGNMIFLESKLDHCSRNSSVVSNALRTKFIFLPCFMLFALCGFKSLFQLPLLGLLHPTPPKHTVPLWHYSSLSCFQISSSSSTSRHWRMLFPLPGVLPLCTLPKDWHFSLSP